VGQLERDWVCVATWLQAARAQQLECHLQWNNLGVTAISEKAMIVHLSAWCIDIACSRVQNRKLACNSTSS
jgi:hypothetical protein